MDDVTAKHIFSVEVSNEDRLTMAALMSELRDLGYLKSDVNLGQFAKECLARGLNDYRKDLRGDT